MNRDEVTVVNQVAQNVLDKVTNLWAKGVNISNINNPESYRIPFVPDYMQERLNPLFAVAKGKNAAYLNKDMFLGLFKKNTIIINKEKLPLAVFHEIGHAFNFNNSTFFRIMQKMRGPGIAIAGTLALFCALTKTTKAQKGKELTKLQKAKNTVRENATILAFSAMVPTLAEEGMASIRGCEWAKALLNKNLANKVIKTNMVAYLSYLSSAAGVTLAAYAAKKVKDKFSA